MARNGNAQEAGGGLHSRSCNRPASLPGGLGRPLHAERSTSVIYLLVQNAKSPPRFVGYASRMHTPPIRLHQTSPEKQNVITALRVGGFKYRYGLANTGRHHFIGPEEANMDSSDHEDLFASPSEQRTAARGGQQAPKTQNSRYDAEEAQEAREAALRRELEGVRNINEVIEGVIGTLERAKGNMGVCALNQPARIKIGLQVTRLCPRR